MDVLLLGPIEVRLDDAPISLGARKERALLAMLGLDAGRAVSAERLIEGLWGEDVPPSAPKLVQHYVSRLRRSLEGNGAAILTRGRGYELQLADGDVDVLRVERLLDERRPREALALWRGEPLADVADEPFAASEIRRLEELRLRAAELAIDDDLAHGRHAEVIAELDALIAQHPLRERLHSQRMLALYRAGRQAEALDAYRRARAVLVEEIGVEPGPELRGLQLAVLAHDPALALDAEPVGPAMPPPARRRRRPVLAAAALIVLAAAVILISRLGESEGLAGIPENAVGVIETDGGAITGQYPAGRGTAAMAAGGGSVWTANTLDGSVTRIDGPGDRVVTIGVGGRPDAVVFGGGSLWVADGASRSVAQIDPGANNVAQRLDVGNAPAGLAFAGDALWVVSASDAAIHRVDLDRGRVTRSVSLAVKPTAIAAGGGALWVASEETGTVTRIDERSGAAVKVIRVGNAPSAIATGEGAVWVVNRYDGTLSRIDPAAGAVSWTVPVGADPRAVTAGEGSVWVAGGDEGTVSRVDPRSPRVVDTIAVGSPATAIATADGRVWAATGASAAAHRGGTLRVLVHESGPDAATVDWLTPEGYQPLTFQLTSLAYDGLVAYRRVDGASGTVLVGGLATEAPAPGDDGREYVFTLRPGLRYSDGRPVRPEDFRTSMERLLQVTRARFRPYYGGIVGARACMRRPADCDLSRGILTDRRARTITVRLARPDADFLHALTLPFAHVVPSDTPPRPTGDHPPPGTGPYRFADWNSDRGGVLVRNAHFRRAPQGRPAGYADRIELRVGRVVDDAIADVSGGKADLIVVADAFASSVPRERLAPLIARAPGQLHSASAASVEYMFLNVRRPPFDDIRVRRALNDAVDRARIVDLVGGADLATPSCQILPAGFPGYEPYCPYGVSQSRGGWSGADLARARRLVAASGQAGAHVSVLVPGWRRAVGEYFAGLLRVLGMRASARVFDDDGAYFATVLGPGGRAQIGYMNWAPDHLAPSNFIEPNFGCGVNPSHLCDARLTRLAAQGHAAFGAESSARWAAADRRIVDIAAAVPLTNRRELVLVSKRVGNVQHHPQLSTLLDQLWVR